MSEAVEWRIAMLQNWLLTVFSTITGIVAAGFGFASIEVGGAVGAAMMLIGAASAFTSLYFVGHTWADRKRGYVRAAYIWLNRGEWGDPPLHEWGEELEKRGAFEGGTS